MQADESQAPAMRRRVELRRAIYQLKGVAIFGIVFGAAVLGLAALFFQGDIMLVALAVAMLAQGGLLLRLSPLLRGVVDEVAPAVDAEAGEAA